MSAQHIVRLTEIASGGQAIVAIDGDFAGAVYPNCGQWDVEGRGNIYVDTRETRADAIASLVEHTYPGDTWEIGT